MISNPLHGLLGYREERFQIVQTERRAISPDTRLISERTGERREKNGPFSLWFRQIVALMLPHRSVCIGLLLVVMAFPPWLK
ncbi:MAG: hypothetical protein U0361_22805 [Nitrospiraceae bacterium]